LAPTHPQVRSLLLGAERKLSESFETDVSHELSLVDDASSFLAMTIGAVPVTDLEIEIDVNRAGIPDSDDVATMQLHALKFIGIRTVRVVRAARSALAAGYEPEARSYDRILLELADHVDGVLNDPSGKTALDWWKGNRRHGIKRRLTAKGAGDLYHFLSQDAHGDPQPVIRLIDESSTLDLAPQRTIATQHSLLFHAVTCRNHGVAIANVGGIRINGLPTLDQRILATSLALADTYSDGPGPV